MTQAVAADTGAHEPLPTGKFPGLSRRGVIAAAVVGGAASAAGAIGRTRRADGDTEFWRAHASYTALLARFETDPDESDDNWANWNARIAEAEADLMCIPVLSPPAMLAKLKIAREHEIDGPLRGKAITGLEALQRDLELLSTEAL